MLGAYDAQNQLSSAQAVTTSAVVSTDSYDKEVAAIDLNPGRKMGVAVIPTADAAGTVVATSYKFEVIQATDAALTTSIDSLGEVTYAGSEVKKGSVIEVAIQKKTSKRYLGLRITPTGGTLPTAAFDAYFMPIDEIPKNPYFAKVINADV